MDEQWSMPAWVVLATLAGVLLLAVGSVVALRRVLARTAAALDASRADAAALAARVEVVERRLSEPVTQVDGTEYVVTMLGRAGEPGQRGEPGEPEGPAGVPAPLFADLVLREGVVQAASWAVGVRRALAPETRHRIRWEMKREVKRARKQRRDDLRRAKREFEARQRGEAAA